MSLGRKYAVTGSTTDPGTTLNPIAAIYSGTTVRGLIYDLTMGVGTATPADNSAEFDVLRVTTTGAGVTTLVPPALEPADPAAISVVVTGWTTTQPTETATTTLLRWSQNSRATFRWVAAPNSEIVIPATTSNGVATIIRAHGGSTTVWDFVELFAE